MIVTGTFMVYGLANDDIADRLNYIATMFLTGQAFQVVATSETPSLGYLTMIDYFLVIGNIFIYLQFVLATFVNIRCTRSNPTDAVNMSCLTVSAGLYAVFTFSWILWARFVSIPKELTKLNATQLDLYSSGFVYILTYLDICDVYDCDEFSLANVSKRSLDQMQEQRVEDLSNMDEITQMDQGFRAQLVVLNKKDLKITQIVGKRVEDEAAIFQMLSGNDLKSALNLAQPGQVQHAKWKQKNMDRIKAKKIRKRIQRKEQKNRRDSIGSVTASQSQVSSEPSNNAEIMFSQELKKSVDHLIFPID